VIISGVNFSEGNEVVGVSIREVIRIDHVIALALAEAEGLRGADEAVRGN
jgi:hypothetical protein